MPTVSISHHTARRRGNGLDPMSLPGWTFVWDGRTLAASGLSDGATLSKWSASAGSDQLGTARYRTGGWADFYWPGTDTGMNASIGGSPLDQSKGWSLYSVYRVENLNAAQSNPAGFCDIWLAQSPAVNGFTWYVQSFQSNTPGTTNSAPAFWTNVGDVGPLSTLPFASPFRQVVSIIATPPALSTGTLNMYINGTLVATTTNWHLTPSDNLSGIGVAIGNTADTSTRQLQAKVGWFGGIQTAHSDATRQGIETFLASIWP